LIRAEIGCVGEDMDLPTLAIEPDLTNSVGIWLGATSYHRGRRTLFDCGAFSLRGAAWHPGTPFRSSVRDVYL